MELILVMDSVKWRTAQVASADDKSTVIKRNSSDSKLSTKIKENYKKGTYLTLKLLFVKKNLSLQSKHGLHDKNKEYATKSILCLTDKIIL